VTLAAGEERSGMDLQLRLIRTARVEGTVQIPAGVSPQAVNLLLTPGLQGSQQIRLGSMMLNNISPDADGKFVFVGVAPGQYTINARASTGGPGGPGARAGGAGAGRTGGGSGPAMTMPMNASMNLRSTVKTSRAWRCRCSRG
jgi:hypothetical protein